MMASVHPARWPRARGADVDVGRWRSRRPRSRSRSAARLACAICRPCWPSSSANTRRPASRSRLVDFKGGSQALTAVLGGWADVVSGYFDHCVNLAAKNQHMQAFVVYDRYPGFALVVSPKSTDKIKSVKDLANKKVGVSAPGSSTASFLKYLLKKNGVDPNSVGVIGIGLGATAVAAMEQGTVEAAIMLDPAVTLLQGKNKDLKFWAIPARRRTRSTCSAANIRAARSTPAPTGSRRIRKTAQALTNAIVNTLKWIHSHTPEEIMAKMPDELVGPDKALYLAALKNTIPMYSMTGRWTRRARRRCSPCSASRRRKLPRPISTCPRPTPTSSSSRRRQDELMTN